MRKWRERDIFTRAKENQRNLLRQLLKRAVGKVLAQAGVERVRVELGEAFDPTTRMVLNFGMEKWISQPSRQSSNLAIYMKTSFSGWQAWLSSSG